MMKENKGDLEELAPSLSPLFTRLHNPSTGRASDPRFKITRDRQRSRHRRVLDDTRQALSCKKGQRAVRVTAVSETHSAIRL